MQVHVKGTTKSASAVLGALAVKLESTVLGPAIAEFMTPVVQQSTEARFTGEGDQAVGKWEPLAKSTIDQRLKMGFGRGPINVRTGEMKDSVTDAAFFGISRVSQGFVQLRYPEVPPGGELLTKVKTAQGGKTKDGMVTPPRPILSFTQGDLEQLLLRTAGWLTQDLL